jgi:hypothetical protein
VQWFPTTVPRNTSVPQAVAKCSAEETNLTYFTVLFELFGLKCSMRGFSMPEVFRDNFWGQKCSAIGKRLGTTGIDRHNSKTKH